MVYIILGVCLVGLIYFAIPKKTVQTQDGQNTFLASEKQTDVLISPQVSSSTTEEAAPRTYVQGPKLSRDDDAFYALMHATIAQTLAVEGINPEGGFAIRAIKPVYDADRPRLSLKENEALYAVIAAVIGRTLAAEGINPEGGFAIQSVQPM